MAAPIRFLSGRQQQQKIGIEGNTGNEKVLEVVGRVGIGTTIFEPDSELEVRGNIKVSGIITASNINVSSGNVNIDQLNVTGIATFGRIVGAATSNVIPFLYSNFTDLPSAATYHGAFAHVHSTGRAYYAHAGNWFELVNKESTGTVGTGTERYNIGPVDLTTLDVSGISTFTGTADFNGDVDIDGHTELDNVNISGIATAGILTATTLRGLNAKVYNVLEVDNVSWFDGGAEFGPRSFNKGYASISTAGIATFVGVNISGVSTFAGNINANGNIVGDSSTNISGINSVTATSFFGDGSGLQNTGATLGAASGSQRLVLTSLTSGTMTSAATDADLSFDAASNLLSAGKLLISGISTFNDDVTFTGASYNVVWDKTGDYLRFEDNAQAVFGTNSDLKIYSDNSDSYIINTQNNDIIIDQQVTDKSIQIKSDNGSGGSALYLKADGNTGEAILYHYGTQKLATKSNGIDVTGHTETDTLNVSGVSTFSGAIDANGGLDVSGGSGLVASSAKISDLTDNRIVIAGASGELEDTSKVTFDGTTFSIVGNATFTGNVSIAGTLTSEDKTNIDSIGIVTARTGVRINSGGLVVSSGVATFTDAIDANGGVDATTAKVSDLTSGRVVIAGTGGELQDSGNLTFNGTTLTASSFAGNGANITDISISNVIGAVTGITIREEGSIVGSASSIGSVNFVSSNLTATASGSGSTITLTNNPSFTNLSATNVSASSSITGNFYGNGSNITDINVDQVIGAVTGITIREEGSVVGTASSVGSINFVSSNLTASASGIGATISLTNNPTFDTVEVTNNITANGNIVGDNSTNITGIDGVTASTLTGTLQTAAQTNITSVGTLGNLTVSGTSTFNNAINIEDGKDLYFRRSNANVVDLFAGNPDGFYINILKGIFSVDSATATGSGNIKFNTKSGATIANRINNTTRLEVNGSGIDVTGIVTATTFSGSGASLTNLPASTTITVADESSDTTCFPLFVTAATGDLGPKSGSNLTFDSSTGTLTATDFNSASDENLKENIRTIENPLAKVAEIRGVNFDWKENQKPSVGVIAQEVEKVFPELVLPTGFETKSVNYNGLVGLLIEVVKEQQTQINSLNERLSQLE